jgi:acyl-CoA dehydrogenase
MTVDFTINDEQRALRDGFRDLLGSIMTEQRTREVLDGPTFSTEIWREICAGGWLEVAAAQDEDDGPGTASLLVYLTECVGAGLVPGSFALVAGTVVPARQRFPGEVAPALYDAVVSGTEVATIVLPSAGTPIAPEWRAIRAEELDGDHVRLAGRARGVVLGHLADWVLIPVSRDDGTVAIAIVAGPDLQRSQDGELAFTQPVGTVAADGLRVAKSAFLGGWEADLRAPLTRWLQRYLLCVDAESIGGADAVLTRTVAFVNERRQFGAPVGSFQAVKHLLADAYGEIEVARGLTEHVAWRFDQEPDGCLDDLLASRILAADMYPSVVERCIQCHGGAGFTWEQGLHGWYRQALFNRHHPFSPDSLRECLYERVAGRPAARG